MTIAEKEEIRAFLTLNRLRIEGRRRAVALLSEGKSAREAETLMESEDLFKDIAGAGSAFSFNVEKEMETCAQSGIGFLLFSDIKISTFSNVFYLFPFSLQTVCVQ